MDQNVISIKPRIQKNTDLMLNYSEVKVKNVFDVRFDGNQSTE